MKKRVHLLIEGLSNIPLKKNSISPIIYEQDYEQENI